MSAALPYGREVHNHGVEEGRGLYCPERIAVDGYPIGECIVEIKPSHDRNLMCRNWGMEPYQLTAGQILEYRKMIHALERTGVEIDDAARLYAVQTVLKGGDDLGRWLADTPST